MSYLDIYKKRITHLGNDYQEHAFKSGILEFRRYLKYNQHTEKNLSLFNQETIQFPGVILTDKEDENRVSQILLTKLVEDGGPELKVGNLIRWGKDEYPWIIWRSTTSSYQPHQKFYMVRCNYEINWLDKDGMLHSSWIYLVGSKDSKIKDNFRTWHNVITPQPNKFINLILPHVTMPINTEIMVLDEVWYLVDYDQNSVPGVVFMSFTETNLNLQRDDVENRIANADQISEWKVVMASTQTVGPKQPVPIQYHIFKDGIEIEPDEHVTIQHSGNLYKKNGQIYTTSSGRGYIEVKYNGAIAVQEITISEELTISPVLVGDDKIRTGFNADYILENTEELVKFTVSDEKLVKIKRKTSNSCTIYANEENKTGFVTLTAQLGEEEFKKEIAIIPLWQVN